MDVTIGFAGLGRTGRWALTVTYENESERVRPLIFDAPPRNLTGARVILAGLLFAKDAEKINTPNAVSGAFSRALAARGISVSSPVAKAKDRIQATSLTLTTRLAVPKKFPGRDQTILYLPTSERFQGSMRGVKELIVASNAHWLSSEYGVTPLLAAGILFADDLMAREVILDKNEFESIPANVIELLTEDGLQISEGA